ncbi:hypothetical protein PIB30_044631 [Stylosanthes scabra]|uniref:Uncharacterized protein n=1 Tax=Stylosanthes scabra TaxID=79078 RepID=A0ABU6UEP0_9FABA|nr:hypothetical protein [Stylosanthes scabra]
MLGRGIHILIRYALFSSPIDVGLHNPPSKGAQRPRWHIDPGSVSDTTWIIAEAPHTYSSKRIMLGRGIHTLIRHASFSSPTDVELHNPPPKGAQRPRWHIDPDSASDTNCNSPNRPLTRYCPLC